MDRVFAAGAVWIAMMSWVACQSSPAPTPNEPPSQDDPVTEEGETPAEGDVALVVQGRDIVRMSGEGDDMGALATVSDTLAWCAVDNRTEVLWFIDNNTLYALDLRAADASPVPISALPESGVEHVEIAYRDAVLNRAREYTYGVALRVDLSDPSAPTLAASIGCGGNMIYYCYEDNEAEPGGREGLIPEYAAAADAISALTLQESDALSALVGRDDGPLWSPPPSPGDAALPRLATVSPDGCRVYAEDCGAAERLDGTPYWRVVVYNDEGDFYYQEYALYDPRSERFFTPGGEATEQIGPGFEAFFASGGVVSPSGAAYATPHAIVHFEEGALYEGRVCGWMGGGFPFGAELR